jgi:hypothetical protein
LLLQEVTCGKIISPPNKTGTALSEQRLLLPAAVLVFIWGKEAWFLMLSCEGAG